MLAIATAMALACAKDREGEDAGALGDGGDDGDASDEDTASQSPRNGV